MTIAVGSLIEAQKRVIDKDVQIGPDVRINCRSVKIGAGARIGVQSHTSHASHSSYAPGVHIECDELELGAGCEIGRSVLMAGGKLAFGAGCRVSHDSTFRVTGGMTLGVGCRVGPENTIEGRNITIGRELWTGPQVRIGGGSCFEAQSSFVAGYWLHLGMRVFVNTARPVTIGNEVGIGTGSMVFTHGAYQSALDGYPVSFAPVEIGDNCWIPGAVINPGVTVGAGAVIGVGSVVTKSIPAGCLTAGVPCKVIKENAFPRQLSPAELRAFFAGFLRDAAAILADAMDAESELADDGLAIKLADRSVRYVQSDGMAGDSLTVSGEPGETRFYLGTGDEELRTKNEERRTITGPADRLTEKLRDLLRRYGIRFFAEVHDGRYRDWRGDARGERREARSA
jgi:acetyltransferase-like isoleucine patch superfamily enzyme